MGQWFLDRTVATKQLLAFSLLAVLIALLGYASVVTLQTTNAELQSVYDDRVVCLKQIKIVGDAFAVDVVDNAHKVRRGTVQRDEAIRRIRAALATSTATWKDYTSTYLTPDEKRLVDQALPLLATAREASDRLLGILARDDRAALGTFVDVDVYPAFEPLAEKLNELTELQLGVAKDLVDAAHARFVFVRRITLAAIAVAIAIAVALGLFLARILGRPAAAVADALDHAAQGDFTVRVPIARADELGRTARSFNAAMDRIGDALAGVDAIARMLAERAAELSLSSDESSAAVQAQAAALEETAASLEEISATVKENASIAAQVAADTSTSETLANQAGSAVAGAANAMGEIRSVSQRIGQIVGSIDEIAMQTNLLALNAAVEAARAGDHGRGFAVVASEVRTLALRAGESSREIHALVEDATHRIDDGADSVGKSVHAIEEILEAVKHVTAVVSDIAHASAEQSTGVTQITDAVAEMDTVTQGNSARTEEIAATAQRLSADAAELRELVARFRLPRRDVATAASAPDAAGARPSPHGPQHREPPRRRAA